MRPPLNVLPVARLRVGILREYRLARTDRVVVTPANERLRFSSAEPGLLELSEQGIYEIRSATGG